MPTPLLHSAVAVASARLATRSQPPWKVLGLFLFLSNLPDVDLIPGLWIGHPMQYHHSFTHSFFFAALAACVFGSLRWDESDGPRSKPYWARSRYLFLACVSHPLLDLTTFDSPGMRSNYSPGLILAWPFYSRRWDQLLHVFEGAYFTANWHDWFIRQNLKVFTVEAAVGLGLIGAAWLYTSLSGSVVGTKSSAAEFMQ